MGTLNLNSGTITGLNAGGLPDGSIQAADFASGVGGKLLQVVQSTVTAQVSEDLTADTWTDISGLSLNITPAATSSKILVTYGINLSQQISNKTLFAQLVRDSTAISIGDATGDRVRVSSANRTRRASNDGYEQYRFSTEYLDSPNTTSQITYKVQWRNSDGNIMYLNRSYWNNDNDAYATSISNILAMEVAG